MTPREAPNWPYVAVLYSNANHIRRSLPRIGSLVTQVMTKALANI